MTDLRARLETPFESPHDSRTLVEVLQWYADRPNGQPPWLTEALRRAVIVLSALPAETPAPDTHAALRNIRLRAARGRVFGHNETMQPMARMVSRKDEALDDILRFCAEVGHKGSIFRGETPAPETPPADLKDTILPLRSVLMNAEWACRMQLHSSTPGAVDWKRLQEQLNAAIEATR